MAKSPTLKVAKRTLTGRKVKQLRSQNIIPANVFGKKIKSQAVKVDLKEFSSIHTQVGETGLISLQVDVLVF